MMGWIAAHTGLPSLRVVAEDAKVQVLRDGESWFTVAAGETRLVSDAAAPLGTPVVYAAGSETVTLTRADTGRHLITDARGRNAARVRAVGADDTEIPSGVSFFDQGRPFARWPLARQYETGEMVVRTDSEDTAALAELAHAKSPVFSMHSPSACEIEDCDIPAVRQIVLTSANNQRTGRVDRAVREWDLSWRETDQSKGLAPVVTWGEYTEASDGWTHESYEDLCVRIAGMPPPPEWVEAGRNLLAVPQSENGVNVALVSNSAGSQLDSPYAAYDATAPSGTKYSTQRVARANVTVLPTQSALYLSSGSLTLPATPGEERVFKVSLFSAEALSVELRVLYFREDGSNFTTERSGPSDIPHSEWVQLVFPSVAPDEAVKCRLGIYNIGELALSDSSLFKTDAWAFLTADVPWFSGDHAPDCYRSEWLGEPNNSVSVLYEFK